MFQMDPAGYRSRMGKLGTQDPLKPGEPVHHAVVGWTYELRTKLDSLSAVLDLAQDLAVRCQESMNSFGARLRSEACSFADWSDSHPCPDPNLSYLLGKVGLSCRALADLVDMESTNPNGPDWMFIDVRSNQLRHLLAKAVEELAGAPDPIPGTFDHPADR